MVEPDTIIDGRYKVISRVGSGGMADVYLAEDQLLGRQVAVKLLHHHFAEDQEFVERFRREASSAAGLSHQNIVGIFDRGEWEGTYYIAMEYVAGRSLKSVVREDGPLDPANAIDIVIQILRGARFAHRRGVVHRDLKPHNVIIDEEGRARVTDFGIARAGASDMTLTGSIMGTAQYLSPEQAQGYMVSGTSDLYSIGVILYELLTGVVPFDGETAVAIAFKQVSAQARPPSEVNPAVPPALDAVVLRALAKDPAQRYADADEFIAALVRERQALPAASGAVLAGGSTGEHQGYGAAVVPAGAVASGQPPDGAQPVTGAMLLADDGYDEDNGDGDGPGVGRVVLWGLLAALVVGAIVAAVLLLSSSPRQVTVPNVTGETEQAAEAKLRASGLSGSPSLGASLTVSSGRVISQSPSGGRRISSGSRVRIVVSSGPGSAALPGVEGLTSARAVSRLRTAGFKPTTKQQPSAKVAQGKTIGTEPPAGTELQEGSPVTVLVSSGPAQVRVPDVSGDSQSGAEAALAAVGLAAGTVTQQVSAAQAAGNVISQSPAAGSSVRTGAKVNLAIAKASNEVVVPGVVGQSETQAAAALGGAGFAPTVVTTPTADESKVGVVLKQSPSAGRNARKGSTVTLDGRREEQRNDPHNANDDADDDADDDDHASGHASGGRRGMTALTVAVLAGGRSSEHEVSLSSGAAVRDGLRAGGHEVVWVEIARDGAWRLDGEGEPLSTTPGGGLLGVDVAFPVLHGRFGEDGTVQGMLEMLGVAYVGSGVAASALCMDKVLFKELMEAHGTVPQVEYVDASEGRLAGAGRQELLEQVMRLGLPVFVKPAHLGSSVGIVKVAAEDELLGALETAFSYDARVIVEAAAGGAEVECAVLGSSATGDMQASLPGEIVFEGEFYDFEAKYQPGGMELLIPARISEPAAKQVRELALRGVLARRLRRSGAGRLLRRRRARPAQRAEHDARLHADERVREVDGRFRGGLSRACRSAVPAGNRAPREAGRARVLTGYLNSVSSLIDADSWPGGSVVSHSR